MAFNNDLMVASVNGRGTAFAVREVKSLFESRMRQAAFLGVVAANYDVSPDGQRFLIAVTEGVAFEPPITLLSELGRGITPLTIVNARCPTPNTQRGGVRCDHRS